MRERLEALEADGFVVLPRVFPASRVEELRRGLAEALGRTDESGTAIRAQQGTVYAARNVLDLWPAAADVWRVPALTDVLAAALGPHFGLVRALFFDKPPEQTWSLPWHKDLTVAVRDHRRPSRLFAKPTTKAGVAHAEAPPAVLAAMLTARVHLDAMTEANGPLQVLPGSHRAGKAMPPGGQPPRPVLGDAGDVLLMRPLVAHASGRSRPGTREHRRVLHLEFAAARELPDGYEWHTFLPAAG